jgi:hypothetical protein
MVGRVPSCAKRKEKPDTDLSAFSLDLRSCSEADLQDFSTLPQAGIQSYNPSGSFDLRACFNSGI